LNSIHRNEKVPEGVGKMKNANQNRQSGKRGLGGPTYLLNPNQVASFINQTVDFTLNSGQRVCRVFIHSVSPETNPQNSTYGDFTYLVFQNGKFYMISNNAANISQIGLAGSICM
jgi:hypothetical protein